MTLIPERQALIDTVKSGDGIPVVEDNGLPLIVGFPPALVKAAFDAFDYAAKLTSGEVVYFGMAELHEDWVTLYPQFGGGEDFHDRHWGGQKLVIPAPRGLDVRLDQIVWVADAPWGS